MTKAAGLDNTLDLNILQGTVRGYKEDGHYIFKGIPYAKPPVGELRWKAPQKPDRFKGTFDAVSFGNKSWQLDHKEGSFWKKEFYSDDSYTPPCSEDCLNLNIWLPEKCISNMENGSAEKLPVAVWFHGGAFTHGWNSEMEMDGAGFARRGVILVTANYRVWTLGFLAHPWLMEEGHAGNYGTLDQIAALRWVKENIGGFGGDPSRVTIFGQSAGAMSVQTIMSSELSKGLFHQAIMQSGAGYQLEWERVPTLDELIGTGERLVQYMGCHSREELYQAEPEALMNKTKEYYDKNRDIPLCPCIDGYLLKQSRNETIKKGLLPDMPCIIGSNAQDGDCNLKGLVEGGKKWSIMKESLGHQPSYLYLFNRQLLGDQSGAFHSAELWYVFETLKRSWRPKTEGDYALSSRMADAWANFIKTGNPNDAGTDKWRLCTKEDPYVMEFDCE